MSLSTNTVGEWDLAPLGVSFQTKRESFLQAETILDQPQSLMWLYNLWYVDVSRLLLDKITQEDFQVLVWFT